MEAYAHRTKKRFGQHFLHDRGVISRMLATLALQKTDRVVEIGPGAGALTLPLLQLLPELHVVEIDRDVIAWWRSQHELAERLHIHATDALKLDLTSLQDATQQPLRIIGNLPYNISTPILFHLLDQAQSVRDMLFMLQKEVVDRMIAAPDSADYGRLSVMIQYYCDTSHVMDVGPGAFNPPPKVDSAVVYLRPWHELPYPANNTAQFSALVAKAFSQRRKTLRNTLKGVVNDVQFEQATIDPSRRAETLNVADFVKLANLVTPSPIIAT